VRHGRDRLRAAFARDSSDAAQVVPTRGFGRAALCRGPFLIMRRLSLMMERVFVVTEWVFVMTEIIFLIKKMIFLMRKRVF
jgi:hypothetical protein